MSDQKAHHYLPQFYLRNFGVGESIALYNLDRKRDVPRASIAGQCQRPYLYGRDGRAERKLGELETKAATIVRRLLADRALFEPASDDHFVLTIFLSYQLGRTPQMGERYLETVERMRQAIAKGVGSELAERNGLLVSPTRNVERAVRVSLTISRKTAHVLLDLRPKLLVNMTDTAFITSDSPLVLLNSWCRGWNVTGVIGLMCSGLQIFVPLSPEVVLLLYDDGVYDVDRPKHSSILVRQRSEVVGINGLQLCSADQNLYYRTGGALSADIDGLPWRWRDQRVGTVRVGLYKADDGQPLITQHVVQPDVRLDLGFVRIRRDMRHISLRERARMRRPGAEELHARFGEKDERARLPGKPGQTWKLVESETK